MAKNRYIAIIGDIHASRSLENREAVQNKLTKVLESLNKKYAKELLSTFSISMGDSFQGLLSLDASFIAILTEIELSMSPVAFRFGIGIGEITTDIHLENSQLNDGPAYHRARKAMDMMEDLEQKYATRKTNIMMLSDDEESPNDLLINAVFALNYAIQSKWSDRQREIIATYLANNENQYETANALDIGQSSISKALKSASFYSYKSSLEDVDQFMKAKTVGEMTDV